MSTSSNTPTSLLVTHFPKPHLTAPPSTGREEEEDDDEKLTNEFNELLLSLPREKGWRTPYLYKFQGFWCSPKEIQAIMSFQKHFQAKDTDVVLATFPKSGTTWLKALAFAILNRNRFKDKSRHPLLSSNPHDLVPFFEYKVYANKHVPDLSGVPDPRIFAAHVPFGSLQESIKKSNCRIVYICRNPFDNFTSLWFFINNVRSRSLPPLSMEEIFNMYCNGFVGYGPFWDHMLGYWKESLERPDKVLFLMYEDMKEDVTFYIKKLAKFLGCPFSVQEERDGVVEDIAQLCCFENLKDLEVNKSGNSIIYFENKHLFRKGEVGDWMNYFSPSMVEELRSVMEEKLGGSGLEFKIFTG